MSIRFEVQALTEQETRQLRGLLIRYLAYHAAGFANGAIDTLIAKFRRSPALIEPPSPIPNLVPKRRQVPKAAKKVGLPSA